MKKVLGIISDEIIKKWDIQSHKDKKIVIYDSAIIHAKTRHLHQYKRKKDYYYTVRMLSIIIRKPDYVFYDKNKKGLEYYKRLNEYILVAVRVDDGKELKVKSFYPVKESKINNRKKKETIKSIKMKI